MQFRVLVEVALCEIGGMLLVEVLFCEIDGRVLGGMQFRVLVEVPLCETDGRALGGVQFGVAVQMLFRVAVGGAADRAGFFPR